MSALWANLPEGDAMRTGHEVLDHAEWDGAEAIREQAREGPDHSMSGIVIWGTATLVLWTLLLLPLLG